MRVSHGVPARRTSQTFRRLRAQFPTRAPPPGWNGRPARCILRLADCICAQRNLKPVVPREARFARCSRRAAGNNGPAARLTQPVIGTSAFPRLLPGECRRHFTLLRAEFPVSLAEVRQFSPILGLGLVVSSSADETKSGAPKASGKAVPESALEIFHQLGLPDTRSAT